MTEQHNERELVAMKMTTRLLNEHEVAAVIGMSVSWVRRMRWAGGGIPFVRMNPTAPRGAVRYRSEDVDKFVSDNQRRSTSE